MSSKNLQKWSRKLDKDRRCGSWSTRTPRCWSKLADRCMYTSGDWSQIHTLNAPPFSSSHLRPRLGYSQATSCNFTKNYSPLDGGAIIITGAGAIVRFDRSRFEENTAGQSGGFMRADSAFALEARDCVFSGNVALGTLHIFVFVFVFNF